MYRLPASRDRRVVSQLRSDVPQSAAHNRRQDASIQTLRGIAVIFMVAGHVIVSHHGLRVGFWDCFYRSFVDIRMPLFTLISGYVYAMVPVARWQDCLQLVKGKSRRLLLPLMTVSTVLYVAKWIVPSLDSNVHDIAFWHIYTFRFVHLWFLQSLFVIFLVVGILDSFGFLASRMRWSIATAVAAIIFVFVDVPAKFDVFTVSGALRLLPFFLLGYGLRRHSLFDLRGVAAMAATLAFAGVYTLRLLTIFGVYRPDEFVDKAIAVAVGATAVVLIYSARNLLNTRLLAWIGSFSFGIYLLHVFAAAASRKLLEHFGVDGNGTLFVAGLLVGIAAPIAFQLLFRNSAVVRTFILGERLTSGRHLFTRKDVTPNILAVGKGPVGYFVTSRGSGRTGRPTMGPMESTSQSEIPVNVAKNVAEPT